MNVEPRNLTVFVDRHTMRCDRRYPHPIELVFEAVSTGEQLNAWLLPVSRVDRRLGGRCSFTRGGEEEDGMEVGVVTDFEPLRLITYSFEEPHSSMRFELEPDGDGSVLHFTLNYPVPPGTRLEPEDYPGGDLPAGTDTAWRPGQVAGFHVMLDHLSPFLRGEWTAADNAAELADCVANVARESDLDLYEAYRDHIREHCPPD